MRRIFLKENSPVIEGSTFKISQKPTLTFFRGAKDSIFMKDACYMDLEYDVELVGQGERIEVPLEIDITPLSYQDEALFEKQGWGSAYLESQDWMIRRSVL